MMNFAESRNLYTAVVTLGPTPNGAKVDAATTRFGVRTVIVDGYKVRKRCIVY